MTLRKFTKSRNAKTFLAITLLAASALVVLGGGIFIQSAHAVSANTEVTLTFAAGGSASATAEVTGCGSATTVISVNGANQWFYASGSPSTTCTLTINQPASSSERYVFPDGNTYDTITSGTTGNTFTVYDQFQWSLQYTISGTPAGSPDVSDLVSYTYLGAAGTFATPPTTAWVDYGTTIYYYSPLLGTDEGWAISGCSFTPGYCSVVASASSAGTANPTYWHGYIEDAYYTTNDGSVLPGASLCSPVAGAADLTYHMFGVVTNWYVFAEGCGPNPVWMDAGSTWTVLENVFPASPTNQRWDANNVGLTGSATYESGITPEYFDQYAVTASYSIVGGAGTSVAPKLTLTEFGGTVHNALTGTPTAYWSDSAGTWTLPLNLAGAGSNERFQTPLAPLTGTVTGATTLAPVYYHQFKLSLEFSTSDSSSIFSSPTPTFTANQFGTPLVTGLTTSVQNVWYDATHYTEAATSYPGALTTERWQLPAGEGAGTITAGGLWNFGYFHQYDVTFGYTVSPPTGSGYTAPTASYTSFGVAGNVVANGHNMKWVDAGTTPTYATTLPGSTGTHQWALTTETGSIGALNIVLTAGYTQQFWVNIVPNGPGYISSGASGWFNAGAHISFTATANAGHLFVHWTSSSSKLHLADPTSVTVTVTIGGTGTVTAWFR